jgi:hypothetical protein
MNSGQFWTLFLYRTSKSSRAAGSAGTKRERADVLPEFTQARPNRKRHYVQSGNNPLDSVSEPVGSVRKDAERADTGGEAEELKNQIRDLEITNRAKNYFTGQPGKNGINLSINC